MSFSVSRLLPLALAMATGQKLGEPEPAPVPQRSEVRCRLCGLDCRGNRGCSIQAHALLKGWKKYEGEPKDKQWACPSCRKIPALESAILEISSFHRLSKDGFDRIARRHGLHPDDTGLVTRLLSLGWTFCPREEAFPYIGPEDNRA